ncbi:MAG: hypothetical protein ABSA85_15875 [Terracidiphilus sp.]|jgi:hypothetical protein
MRKRHLLLASLAVSSVLCGGPGISSQAKPSTSTAASQVPFVGCASDGQAGPQAAPTGQSKAVAISALAAQRLAWYKAQYGPGVLAPRGWHCFSIYGSDGSNLFVSPDAIDSKTLLSVDWKGFAGQAIQISVASGGTSGRFEVAKVIARVFPAYKQFAQNVIAEGIEPASDFPSGPFASDKLTDRGKNIVEFETPANMAGMGTDSRLLPNASPIDGVAIITGTDTDLIQLSARVAAKDRDLIPFIVQQVESNGATASQ